MEQHFCICLWSGHRGLIPPPPLHYGQPDRKKTFFLDGFPEGSCQILYSVCQRGTPLFADLWGTPTPPGRVRQFEPVQISPTRTKHGLFVLNKKKRDQMGFSWGKRMSKPNPHVATEVFSTNRVSSIQHQQASTSCSSFILA